MIEVEITEKMKKRAWRKAREMGKLKNSITKGDGNIAGFLGEEVANQIICGKITNTYDYDIVDDCDIRYDVKTKRCTSEPKDKYECSVAAYNTKQDCDGYAFVRVLNDFSIGWFLGVLTKQDYFDKATFLKKGDVDPSNNYTVKADCYNVRIDELGDTL